MSKSAPGDSSSHSSHETKPLLSIQSDDCGGPLVTPPAKWRTVIVAMLSLCNVSLYLSRANISIAALYMFTDCLPWQKWVFAGFYLGYCLSQIPAGYMASRIGGKAVLFTGVSVWSVASFLCVPAFRADEQAPLLLVLCRIVIGMAEGCNYPSQVAIVAQWIPASERTTAWCLLSAGEAIGTILAMLTSPYLAAHGGWPLIFYVSGGLGVVWLVLFGLLVSRSPETHPYISRAELDHIVGSRLKQLGDGDGKPPPFCEVPWGEFFRCKAFWGTLATHFCYNYMSYFALSLGPYFFKTKYDVDISSPSSGLGLFSCLPYVFLFFTGSISGVTADWLANKHGWEMTTVRKVFNGTGMLFSAIFFGLLGAPFVQHGPSDHNGLMTAVALLTLGIALGGIAPAGYWANYHDLSAKYGSHMLGIGNSVATIPGMITNIVSGEILDIIHRDPAETGTAWAIVFAISSVLSLIGAIVFSLLGSGDQIDFDGRAAMRRKA